jgi:hypothetical protein
MTTVTTFVAEVETPEGAAAGLAARGVAVVRGALETATCARWTSAVLAARAEWTEDFGGEQFSLGRAFYTHLETERAGRYFDDATASDARVNRHAPGLQAAMRALLAAATGGRVVGRPGWCGAGVHVFPAGGVLADRGGVVHFDHEGLAEQHMARRGRALSLVAMLQPPEQGGGLRVWPELYEGHEEVDDVVLRRGGDEGPLDRISATLHGAEIDRDLWESWF